jgi:hypothetical protein
MGANSHGIPRPFVETSVKSCRSCEYGERRLPRPPQGNVRARVFQQYNERHTMPLAEKDHFINKVKATHTVRLSPIQDYNRVRPYLAYVVIYACHRGKFRGKTMLDDDHNDGVRQQSTAKYVGCNFRMKIVEPIKEGLDIKVFINTEHKGHESGSKTDCYFLPVHQSAIDNCAEMLRNSNTIQLALAYSKRCANILFQKAPVHEQKTFRFFFGSKRSIKLVVPISEEKKVMR